MELGSDGAMGGAAVVRARGRRSVAAVPGRLNFSASETAKILRLGRGSDRGLGALVAAGLLTPIPWGKRTRFSLEEIQRVAREGFRPAAGLVRRPSNRRRKGRVDPAALRALDVETLRPASPPAREAVAP